MDGVGWRSASTSLTPPSVALFCLAEAGWVSTTFPRLPCSSSFRCDSCSVPQRYSRCLKAVVGSFCLFPAGTHSQGGAGVSVAALQKSKCPASSFESVEAELRVTRLLAKSKHLYVDLQPAVMTPSWRQHPGHRTDRCGTSGDGSSLTPEKSQISWGLFPKQFLKS